VVLNIESKASKFEIVEFHEDENVKYVDEVAVIKDIRYFYYK